MLKQAGIFGLLAAVSLLATGGDTPAIAQEAATASEARAAVAWRLPRFAAPVQGAPFSHRLNAFPGSGSAPVDLNGDGRAEIVQTYANYPGMGTNRPEPIVLLSANPSTFAYGNQTTTFISGAMPAQVHPRVNEVGDFNGDGKLDYFLGGHGWDADAFSGELDYLLLSHEGARHTGPAAAPRRPTYTHAAASGDVNGDGLTDIYVGVLCCSDQGPYFLLGREGLTPVASFNRLNARVTSREESHTAAALLEIDGVNGPDLALGSYESINPGTVYLNDGTGKFLSEEPDMMLPTPLYGADTISVDMLATDLNTDGKPDLIISQQRSDYSGMGLQVLVRSGSGFLDQTATRMRNGSGFDTDGEWRAKIFAADFYGDGLVDLVTHRFCLSERDDYIVWLNDGAGYFTPQRRSLIDPFDTSGDCAIIYPVDVNLDRLTDLVRVVGVSETSDKALTYRNLGPNTARTPSLPEFARQPRGATVAAGQPFTLSVSARGTRPLRFQWFRNDVAIAGATKPVLQRTGATNTAGQYKVRVRNAAGDAFSAVVGVTVN